MLAISETVPPVVYRHIPLQPHLSGVSRGAEIETGTDEMNGRQDGIDGRAGGTIPICGESGSRSHCSHWQEAILRFAMSEW